MEMEATQRLIGCTFGVSGVLAVVVAGPIPLQCPSRHAQHWGIVPL